jgi:predicted transcriptional regulator
MVNVNKQSITVGIMPQEQIRERMLAIARGDVTPVDADPKVWFTSEQSLADALSDKDRTLGAAITKEL